MEGGIWEPGHPCRIPARIDVQELSRMGALAVFDLSARADAKVVF